MTRITMLAVTAIFAVLFLIGCASATQITVSDVSITEGGTGTATVTLDQVPAHGLSGFKLYLTITDPTVSDGVTFITYNTGFNMFDTKATTPAWSSAVYTNNVDTTTKGGFQSGYIKAADMYGSSFTGDLSSGYPADQQNVVLATLTFNGLSAGMTTIDATLDTAGLSGNADQGGDNYVPDTTVVDGTINVYAAPDAQFAADTVTPIVGQTVTFSDQSTGSPSSWDFDFGDGSAHASGAGPWTHAYTATGTYNVVLTVTNPAGTDTETKTGYITVTTQPVPVADFTVSATNGLAPVTATFTDASTNTPASWKWEYRIADNGAWTQFSTDQNPVFSATTAGTYDIRLTATNGGGSGTVTKAHQFAAANAEEPLTLVRTGTVSGDLYVESPHTYATGVTEVTHTFTLPADAVGNVQWAKLFVNTYSGTAAGAYGLTSTVEFNGDTLGVETMDIKSTTTGASFPLNDHVTKVYSDYEAQYDVTSRITSASPVVHVKGEAISGLSFDGKIKGITLVVAYNDGDTDTVRYWVNHGQQYVPSGSSGSTAFDASGIASGWTSAENSIRFHSSSDAGYTFNGVIKASGTSPDTGGMLNTWDVTSDLVAGTNTLAFTKSTSYSYKATLATLKARYVVPPTAGFAADRVVATTSDLITFTDQSTGATAWAWDFDNDGTVDSNDQNPTWTYTTEGLKTVKLTVTNEGGSNTMTKTDYINVVNSFISFTPTPQSFLPGETRTYDIVLSSAPEGLAGYDMVVSLANIDPADIVAVDYPSWVQMENSGTFPADSLRISGVDTTQLVWPGASNVVLATITVRGNAVGTTQIALSSVVMDADGGASLAPTLTEGTATIGSYTGPVAAFTGTPVTGNYPLTVAFDSATSTGTITTYQWDFDNDGTIDSTAANPSHTYNAIGTYSVKLTVSGPGGSNTMLKNAYITVTDGVAPTAMITATPTTGNYPLTVVFSAATTGNVQSYAWDFGDGVSSSLAAPSHTYTYPGTFTATLVVTGTGGSSTPDTEVIVVTQDAPVAGIIATPESGTAPLLVQFYDQSTGSITSYDWDFGDGSAHSTDANPSHTYTSAGTFTVTHTVTGLGGTSAPATKVITTTGLGVDFTATETSGVSSTEHAFTTTFTATATPAAGVTYSWDFGDGTTGTGQTVTHSYYGRLGSFTVTVTADNGADTASKTRAGYITTTPYIEEFPKYDNSGTITDNYAGLPTDLDGDFVYEDVNGNGRMDYDDVVAFYNAWYYGWFTTNTDVDNIPDYDYTGNDILNTADVVALYDMVLYG